MERVTKIPNNCTECAFARSCMSFYGNTTCAFHKEIHQSAIARFWEQFGTKKS